MLLVGVAVAAALAVGVIYLEVTIDPVELWASPESRSRQEKDYFDKSFTPFYRTEQVILHAEGLTGVSSLSFFFCYELIKTLLIHHCFGGIFFCF